MLMLFHLKKTQTYILDFFRKLYKKNNLLHN